jgi:amino acid transporter
MGAPRVNVTKWFKLPDPSLIDDTALDMDMGPGFLPRISWGGILWRPFLNNLFWNLNSFDSAASFVTEVSDYKTTFPKACFLSVGMCFFSYLIPLLVAVGLSESEQIDWVDGHLAVVAKEIGGSWLTTWTVFAAGISNFALFEAEMSADAYQLMGMAELGYLPPVFKMKSSHFGTPTMGILTGTIVVVCMGALANLEQIVEMLNFNYSIGLLLEFAAFVKLRHSQKDSK